MFGSILGLARWTEKFSEISDNYSWLPRWNNLVFKLLFISYNYQNIQKLHTLTESYTAFTRGSPRKKFEAEQILVFFRILLSALAHELNYLHYEGTYDMYENQLTFRRGYIVIADDRDWEKSEIELWWSIFFR